MICTFCGTDNPNGNRFCGMCGVRLERRQSERRTVQRDHNVCAECGHDNGPKFKFCGMCGVRIDRRLEERRAVGETLRANAVANAQLPTPELHKPGGREPSVARVSAMPSATVLTDTRPSFGAVVRHQPVESALPVSGPSFLGLSDTSSSAEYLLEDEGGSRHRGLRAFLLLVVLAAIVGLILVQYRSSLNANPKSPQPPNPNPATVPRSESKGGPVVQDRGVELAAAAHRFEPAVAGLAKVVSLSVKEPAGVETDNSTEAEDVAPKPVERVAAKPSPARDGTNDQPSRALVKAQQYLHGDGVRQNCEQGLIYLRAATRENDPQAAVQMGALYSSGLCVTPNRVKAYEWFSTAREMQPDNRWISKNLNQLWAKMSTQERLQIHQ